MTTPVKAEFIALPPLSEKAARNRGLLAAGIMLAVIILDQVLKIYVKTHFYLGESYEIGDAGLVVNEYKQNNLIV